VTDRNVLAADLGAESGRLMLGTFDGSRIRLREIHRFATGFDASETGRRWNVPRLLNELRAGIEKARGECALATLGIDTWGVDGGFLDGNGELCALPFAYREFTEQNMQACQAAMGGADRLYDLTGVQHMPFNTAYQFFALREKNDPTLARADKFLFMPDLLRYLLTGCMVAEETIASTSQMLDPHTRTWCEPVLRTLGVEPGLFAALTAPGAPSGATVKGTGIQSVSVAGHDTGSAVAAVPAEQGTRWAFLSSGTWSILGVESEEPIMTAQARKLGIGNEWGVEKTYRVLRNIMGLWILQGCKRALAERGNELDYPALVKEAEAAEPFAFLIDVDDLRFFAPDDMQAEVEGYCRETGQGRPASVGALVRCVLESLALRYADVLHRFDEVIGQPVEVLHVIGGGVQNELLCRMTADACGVPVVAGPVEATAAGNVIVQLMATGQVADRFQGRRIIADSFDPVRYEPEQRAAWEQAGARLRTLCAQQKETSHG